MREGGEPREGTATVFNADWDGRRTGMAPPPPPPPKTCCRTCPSPRRQPLAPSSLAAAAAQSASSLLQEKDNALMPGVRALELLPCCCCCCTCQAEVHEGFATREAEGGGALLGAELPWMARVSSLASPPAPPPPPAPDGAVAPIRAALGLGLSSISIFLAMPFGSRQ